MTKQTFDKFLSSSKPGASFVYYKGEVPTSRPEKDDPGYNDCPFRMASSAALSGPFVLFQRKLGVRHTTAGAQYGTYEYLITRVSEKTMQHRAVLKQTKGGAVFDFTSMGGKRVSPGDIAAHMEHYRRTTGQV